MLALSYPSIQFHSLKFFPSVLYCHSYVFTPSAFTSSVNCSPTFPLISCGCSNIFISCLFSAVTIFVYTSFPSSPVSLQRNFIPTLPPVSSNLMLALSYPSTQFHSLKFFPSVLYCHSYVFTPSAFTSSVNCSPIFPCTLFGCFKICN